VLPNKGMKLTSAERNGRSQLIPSVRRTIRRRTRSEVVMKLSTGCLAVALVCGTALSLTASEEGALVVSSFNIHSAGIDRSGPVEISGSYDNNQGLTSLVIRALGREFTLTKEQRGQFAGLFLNSVQVTYEAGYREVGGRTIYLVLGRGFLSGTEESKVITLNERGDITVSERRAERGRRTRS
jgi:hypothetical protein